MGIVTRELSAKISFYSYSLFEFHVRRFHSCRHVVLDFAPMLYFRTYVQLEKYLHFSGMIYTVVKRRRFEVTLQILDEIIHDISSRFYSSSLTPLIFILFIFFQKDMHIIYVGPLLFSFYNQRNGNDEL